MGDLDLNNLNYKSIKITNSIIEGNITATNTTLNGDAIFTNTSFKKDATFFNSEIEGNVDFSSVGSMEMQTSANLGSPKVQSLILTALKRTLISQHPNSKNLEVFIVPYSKEMQALVNHILMGLIPNSN